MSKRIARAAALTVAALVWPTEVQGQTSFNALRVQDLPPCNIGRQGREYRVKDANPDCSTGGGTTYVKCLCNGWTSEYETWFRFDGGEAGFAAQSPNYIFAGPASGANATPAFRPLVSADIASSSITSSKIADGTIVNADVSSSAAIALSKLAAGTASKCARFDGSGVLVAASGDCASGAAAGIGGSLGSTAGYIPRASGTDGVTLEQTPNLFSDSSNDLWLDDSSGARRFCLGTVSTAPCMKRSGTAVLFQGNDGGATSTNVNVGWLTSGDSTNPSEFQGGLRVGNGKGVWFSDGVDYARGIERVSGTLSITDGSGSFRDLKVRASRLAGYTSPPYACDSSTDGAIYHDTTGPGTFCGCLNGTGWVNLISAMAGSDCS